MICKHCGKELVKVGEFTDKEIEEMNYIAIKSGTAFQALKPETVNAMKFDDDQLFDYFRSAFDAKAQAEFLQHVFMRDLKKRLGLKQTEMLFYENIEVSKDIYIHPAEEPAKQ